MTEQLDIDTHGLEVLKKSAINPDTTYPTRLALRTYDMSGFGLGKYDYLSVTYPTSIQEVYVFKSGGSGGTTVATITINYIDSSKEQLSTVVKT